MRTLIVTGVALGMVACATTPPAQTLPQVQAWLAAGGPPPPPLRNCPYVADIDLRAIAAGVDRNGAVIDVPNPANVQRFLDAVFIPDSFRRPSADAPVVLTAVSPPSGQHLNLIWSVVWQEADGSWWFWRQDRLNTPIPPPPPPPPPNASAEAVAAYQEAVAAANAPDHVRWPPTHGRLGADKAAALEAALAAPCRAWEPDLWPWNPPMRSADAEPGPPHPYDWSATHVWIREMGRPARMITEPNARDSHAETLRDIAYYPLGG